MFGNKKQPEGRGRRRRGGRGALQRRLVTPASVPAVTAVAASLAVAAGLYALVAPAAAAAPVWHVSRAPKLRVDVAAGCPETVRGYRDVVNTFAGPPLVPAGPTSGLICRYGPAVAVAGTTAATAGGNKLVRATHLDRAQATELATVVRKLDLAPPTGMVSCPAGFGTVVVIGLAYPHRPTAGLWYEASGCESVDNGRIGAFEVANPSFYDSFLSVVDRLSPPVPALSLPS